MPLRRPNRELRSREYLTATEVNQLMAAARARGRHGHRDATMILLAFRHGLRASELVGLRWTQFNLETRKMHVNRAKNGKAARHDLGNSEVEALRQLQPRDARYVFTGERGQLTPAAFAQMLKRAAQSVDFPLAVHPHMLRHACGHKLANDGRDTRAIQDYLGHRNIQHTVRYTELADGRFAGFFED